MKAPCFTGEDLYFRLQNDGLTYGQVMFALKAFEQSGLVVNNHGIDVVKNAKKTVLEDTDILRELKGRKDSGRRN